MMFATRGQIRLAAGLQGRFAERPCGAAAKHCCILLLATGLALPGRADPPPRLTTDEITPRIQQAGKDPLLLLQLVPLAEPPLARQLRGQIKELLPRQLEQATPAERGVLLARLAQLLPQALHSADETREVFGAPSRISRQILQRRYLEQWHYDAPLNLSLVFLAQRGQELAPQTVLPQNRSVR